MQLSNALKLAAIALFICLTTPLSAQQGERYKSDIFPQIDSITNVQYGEAVNLNNETEKLLLDIYMPQSDTEKKRPLLIGVHGGGFVNGNKSGGFQLSVCKTLAKKGYVATSIGYRLGVEKPRTNTAYFEAMYRAVQDAKAAVRFFRKNAEKYGIDTSKIYVLGSSAGSMTVLQLAYMDQNEVPSQIDTKKMGTLEGTSGNAGFSSKVHGVVDCWGAMIDYKWINKGDVPLYCIHGTADSTVPYDASYAYHGFAYGSKILYERALSLGIPTGLRLFEKAGHNIGKENSAVAMEDIISWLYDRVQNKEIVTNNATMPKGIPQTLPFSQIISITNPSKTERKDAVVAIAWKDIMAKNPKLDTANFKVIDNATKKEVPFQLEFKGQKEVQNLLVQVSVGDKATVEISLENGKPTPISPKTYARYVPERMDDFAWENDKIAFRTYGKALEGTKGDAYGLDVWVKRTTDLILNRRYKHGDYHHDLGDGLDYYHVGFTLGAGNIAPIVKDEIVYSKNYHRWKILDMGALRTTFSLEYDAWDVKGTSVTATKTITLDAGSQINKIEVVYDFQGKDTLPVVIGIIKRPEQGSIYFEEKEGVTTYWEPKHGEDGTTGVAVILTTPVTGTSITKDQILTHTTYKKGTPFVYYMGAAWDKAGEIKDAAKWFSYVRTYKNQQKTPLKVQIL
jgi:predicted esterase